MSIHPPSRNNRFYENLLLGKLITDVISLLLQKSGYLVIPYGYESTHPSLLKKIHDGEIIQTKTVKRIRYSPDLLVYDDVNRSLVLVEVKMRTANQENKIRFDFYRIARYKEFYDDAILVLVVNTGDIFYAQKIEALDSSRQYYNVTTEFQKFEVFFDRVEEDDLSHFRNKALEIMCNGKLSIKGNNKSNSSSKMRERYPMAYEKWTAKEDNRLINEFRNGLSKSEIAVAHQRKEGAITSRLKMLGMIKNLFGDGQNEFVGKKNFKGISR
jgi:hypothetical protein